MDNEEQGEEKGLSTPKEPVALEGTVAAEETVVIEETAATVAPEEVVTSEEAAPEQAVVEEVAVEPGPEQEAVQPILVPLMQLKSGDGFEYGGGNYELVSLTALVKNRDTGATGMIDLGVLVTKT